MKNIIYLLSLLLLLGCGGNSSSQSSTATVQVPLKVNIEMPEVISISDDELREYLGTQEKLTTLDRLNKESNYKELKPIMWKIEQLFNEAKFNIFIVNSIMKTIEEECREEALNELCTIPKESIEFLFTQENINQLIQYVGRDKIGKVNQETLLGESVLLGEIEFIRYDENSTYAYALMIDSTETETKFFSIKEDTVHKRTIKWSEDNNKVFYASSSKQTTSTLSDTINQTFHYQNTPNVGESAHITLFSRIRAQSSLGKSSEKNDIFDLTKEHNSSDIFIKIHTMTQDEVDVDAVAMDLSQKYAHFYISDGKGYFDSDVQGETPIIGEDGFFTYNFIAERAQQIFNKEGIIVDRRYCPEFDGPFIYSTLSECRYENPLSWLKEEGHSPSSFEPFEKFYFRELSIWMMYEALKSGEYFLIPPDVNLTNITIEELMKESVGSFVVYQGFLQAQGFIYKKGYGETQSAAWFDDTIREKLDALQIVRSKYNQDLNLSLGNRKEVFELIVRTEDFAID